MSQAPVAIPLREPPRGRLWGPEVTQMSGLEMLRASLEHQLPDAPISRLAGLRLSEASLGLASASMPASPWWQSGAGVFLAGTLAFAADMPLGCSVLTSAPVGWGMTTSELSLNFLRAPTIRCQTIIARSRLIHATRSLGLSEATIEDGRGRLLGHATSRCVLFPLDPEIMASRRHEEMAEPQLPDPYLRPIEGDVRGREFWNSLPGREIVNQVAIGEFVPPCYLLMGLRGVDAGDGAATLAMGRSPWLCNAFGAIYGGAIAFLADATMAAATGSTVPAGTAYNTIDLKINFLRPVLPDEGDLRARATVVHRGRTIALANCDILDASDKLAAQATASFLILPGRFWERPVQVADEFPAGTARVLTTVLYVDVVDSTRRAAELGDQLWREALTDYQSAVREQLQRFNGTEIDSVGDGFLMTFEGAARAIRCAASIRDAVRRAGVEVRAAVHSGECERSGGKLVGVAVHVGARIESLASPGEILVSAVVKELVMGSGITFEARGEHELKGIDGLWPLFAARI